MDTPDTPLRPLTGFQQSLIGLAMVSQGAGFAVNFVVVAPLARSAGLTEIKVAGILTLSAVIYALVIPRWGRLADRIGRKRVMVFSLFAMAGTNMMFLFALDAALKGFVVGMSAFWLLVFTRIWFGLLAPGLQPASMAAMTDATTPATRTAGLGMLGAAMSIGSVLGPAGAAVLANFGALAPIWGSIVFCAICGILLGFALPPTQPRDRETKRTKPLSMNDPRVRPHLLFLFAYFVAVGMIQQTIGWFVEDRYAEKLGLSDQEIVTYTGIVFSALALMMVVIQFGYVQPRRPDPRKMLPIGLFFVSLGYLLTNLFQPYWAIVITFSIVGIGAALAVPSANALATLSVEKHEQGGTAALLSAAPPAGFVVGPLVGAGLYQAWPSLPFFVSSIVMGALAIYALRVTSKR